MKNRHFNHYGAIAVALALVFGISSVHSAEVFLQAEEFQKTIPYGPGIGAPGHSVAVVNASFEDPDCTAGTFPCITNTARGNFTVGAATGWAVASPAGVFRPNASIVVPTDGAQVGWSSGGELVQVLAESIMPGTTYTLTVDVGDSTDLGFGSYVVGLYANGVLLAEDNNSQTPSSGWVTSTVTYTAGPADSGALEIRLDGNGSQEYFDNVQLDAVATAAVVTMWGYSECTDINFDDCEDASSPGPQIDVLASDTTGLTVHLSNTLPEPTSIMIAGAVNAPLPPGSPRVDGRLRSFVPEIGSATSVTSPVAIANASFEDPDCTTGCNVAPAGNFTFGGVTSWTLSGGLGGVFRPNTVLVPTDGAQVGWSGGGELSQVLAENIAPNTTYTLTVDVGDRTDTTFGSYVVGLYAGGVLLAQDNNSQTPSSGWVTSTVTYTSSATDSGALEIRLDGNGFQEEFDNVQLQKSTTTSTVGTYTWTDLDPGSYLYHSGSHVQLQVQMGLYGAVTHDALGCSTAPCAYSDVSYDAQEVLIFSEIDPALHDPTPSAANATVEGYVPQFFLINGEPFDSATTPLAAAAPGDAILLRLLNAGLDNRAPQLLGGYFEILAQDGRRAPASRMQYSALLPAAKSMDVLFTPSAAGVYSLFDRRMKLVNGPVHGGGMFHKIVVE